VRRNRDKKRMEENTSKRAMKKILDPGGAKLLPRLSIGVVGAAALSTESVQIYSPQFERVEFCGFIVYSYDGLTRDKK
jgi:hypothetical protein